MKTKLLILLVLGALVGCAPEDPKPATNGKAYWANDYRTIVIEGCEYIYMGSGNGQTITHKGNCSNPIHHIGDTIK